MTIQSIIRRFEIAKPNPSVGKNPDTYQEPVLDLYTSKEDKS